MNNLIFIYLLTFSGYNIIKLLFNYSGFIENVGISCEHNIFYRYKETISINFVKQSQMV